MLGNRPDTQRHLGKEQLAANGLVELVGLLRDIFLLASFSSGKDQRPIAVMEQAIVVIVCGAKLFILWLLLTLDRFRDIVFDGRPKL